MAKNHITATVNGDAVEFLCESEETLLDVLRDQLHLTGSKEGCASGDCGACSVMLDGRLVCACLVLAAETEGKSVETIEELEDPTPGPETISSSGEQCRQLRAALATLPTEQREAIERAYLAGLSHSEVATALGQPLGTVKSRIRTGLASLRRQLAEVNG